MPLCFSERDSSERYVVPYPWTKEWRQVLTNNAEFALRQFLEGRGMPRASGLIDR
jgi:hypothetical protein